MTNNQQSKQNKSLVVVIATIAATGGLLFGFDTGVISGAIPFFQKAFGITDSWIEIITTAGLVGAVIGAMSSGRIADIVGRKKVILAAAIVFIIGAVWSGSSPGPVMLVFARLFLGIAIGASSFAVPLYIAEISPKTMESKRIRGLYFAGELIDVDAHTGGYNLQIAFSTGALAGQNAALHVLDLKN